MYKNKNAGRVITRVFFLILPQDTLAARGLEELFFQLCCCVSFWFLAGNRFGCYILMYLEYNTVVAL
jgi:hypothetical protein